MKKLLALGTILGAAALLQNKGRRDRLMSQGRSILDNVKRKAEELRTSAADGESGKGDDKLFSDAEIAGHTTNPGYRPPPPPRGNGIY
jgi:hypothetical protein